MNSTRIPRARVWHISPSTTTTTGDSIVRGRGLRHSRNLIEVSLDIVLHLNTLVVGVRVLGRWGTTFTCESDVFMIANRILVETPKDVALLSS